MDNDGQLLGAILVFHDVTEARAMAIRMSHLARHDSLTGLPNRVLMYDRVLQAILQSRRLGQPFALLFLDLDHFKEINDLLGHHMGDLLLKEVGNRLKSCLRASDTVSRQGGDEFIILLTNLTEAEHAEDVIHKLVEALSVPFVIDNHEITVTCSVGAALFPDDGNNPEDLLKHADAAMYLSKAEGRNCYHFYSPELHEHLQSRRRLQIDLRQALEELQFKLVYQPKVNIAQRKVVGAEALLRWQRPCGQIVPPLEFIPLAEETGLILPLGAWVLETACLQCEAWYQETGIRLPVAVNISAKQFADQHFVPMVQACLARTQLPPAYLELEVTESLLMSNAERTRQTVANLKQLGVRVAIDDFGTGYSSLSYLKNTEDRSVLFAGRHAGQAGLCTGHGRR
nr:diguanylate cyclase [Deinococcus proteolyticus]